MTTFEQAAAFVSTQWIVILAAARHQDSETARAALDQLCCLYWRPLYFYLRRQGYSEHDAKDLTQSFFHYVLSTNFMAQATPQKGKFRSFLLASLNNFVANEWAKAKAQKRGGGSLHLPLDFETAETHYRLEPSAGTTPETLFHRKWAITVLDQTLNRLQTEYSSHNKAALFDALKPSLAGKNETLPYAELGRQLNLSEGAVKVAVHRLRQRYREVLRNEIAQTVDNPNDVEAELRHLFQSLSS